MPNKDQKLRRRNWIDRMIDIYNDLELNTLYSPPSIRRFLRNNFNDSISQRTTRKLLKKIIEAQERGIQYKINNKILKLIKRKTSNIGFYYELNESELK